MYKTVLMCIEDLMVKIAISPRGRVHSKIVKFIERHGDKQIIVRSYVLSSCKACSKDIHKIVRFVGLTRFVKFVHREMSSTERPT